MNEPIQHLIDRSSLGTPTARAASRTVHRSAAARAVAAAKQQPTKTARIQASQKKGSTKSGG